MQLRLVSVQALQLSICLLCCLSTLSRCRALEHRSVFLELYNIIDAAQYIPAGTHLLHILYGP